MMAVQLEPKRETVSGCEKQYKYKRQMNSLSGALMPLMTYSTYFMWSVSALYFLSNRLLHATIALYVGLIIGTLIGVYLTKFRKIAIYYFSGILTVASGVILMPHLNPIIQQIVSRYIAGIAQGISLITGIIHGAEISTNNFRGTVLSSISLCIESAITTASFVITVFITYFDYGDRVQGVIIIFYGALGIIFVYFVTYESPIYLLKNNQERNALKTMREVRRESVETWELIQDFNDIKEMIKEDKLYSNSIIADGNAKPLFRMIGLRLLYTISSSVTLMWYLVSFVEVLSTTYALSFISLGRLFGEFVSLFMVDVKGRRFFLVLSCATCGVILMLSSFVKLGFDALEEPNRPYAVLAALAIIYSAALGLGLGPCSIIYLGEAFPLCKKPFSLFTIITIDNFIQIILVLFVYYEIVNMNAFFIVMGGLQLICSTYFYKFWPETKNLSLRDCIKVMKYD